MAFIQKRCLKLWLLVGIFVLFWTIGPGFYKDIQAKGEDTYKSLKLFTDVIDLIENHYVEPVDTEVLIETAIKGMVQGLDPHSALMKPEEYEDLRIDTSGEFSGIGIHITMKDGFVTVISPIEGTPAYKAGVKAGDRIVKVDDSPTSNMLDAVKLIRGPMGTSVKVTVVRKGEPKPIDYEIVRAVIPINSVKPLLLKKGYGYVRITNFSGSTVDDLEAGIVKMEEKDNGLKGLIIDLRNNGGGLLDQAFKVSDLFIEEGVIVSIKGRRKIHTKEYPATPNKVKRNYPIVVLINGGSASASEIVAGALQDHKKALVLGTTSFGKGSVQTVESLRDGYGLKFTIARYYTPNGRSIQNKGIEPDIVANFKRLTKAEIAEKDNSLKERDLRNHIDSKSIDGKSEKKKEEKKEEDDFSLGPLKKKNLMSDSQVRKALEILISFDIFSKISKN